MADRHIIEETTEKKKDMGVKVSFAVAIYNVAAYVEKCVRSLYEQTLEDIEIILVDDCTPDNSMDIALKALEDYPSRKSQVRVIRHEQNQGLSITRRDGILGATGEYVIVIDGDDYVDRRMAALMYAKAAETCADIVICDFYRVYDVNNDRQYIDTQVPDGVIGDGENVRWDLMNRRVPPFHVTKLVSRSIYKDNEMVWPQGNLGEDTVFTTVTVYYAKCIAHVKEPLYYYRYNALSVSHLEVSEEVCLRNYNEFLQNFTIAWQFLDRKGVSEKYKRGEIIYKIRIKNRLLPMVDKCKYRRLWWSTYSEINKVILFGNEFYKPTYKEWMWVFAIMTGLYPRYRKRLRSRRFLPLKEWI